MLCRVVANSLETQRLRERITSMALTIDKLDSVTTGIMESLQVKVLESLRDPDFLNM